MKSDEMGKLYLTKVRGQLIPVRVIQIEQSINSRHRGKWVCLNEATGRKLHRTSRQLHPLDARYEMSLTELAQLITDLEPASMVDGDARERREAAVRELVSRILAAQVDA